MTSFHSLDGGNPFDMPIPGSGMGKPTMPIAVVPIAGHLADTILEDRQTACESPDYVKPLTTQEVCVERNEWVYTFHDPDAKQLGFNPNALNLSVFTSMNGLSKKHVPLLTFVGQAQKGAYLDGKANDVTAIMAGPRTGYNTGSENIPQWCRVIFAAPEIDSGTGKPAVDVFEGNPNKVFPATKPLRSHDAFTVFARIYNQVMAAAEEAGYNGQGSLSAQQIGEVESACAHTHELGQLYLDPVDDPCWKYVRLLLWTLGDNNEDWKKSKSAMGLQDYQTAVSRQHTTSAGRRYKAARQNGFGSALSTFAPASAAGGASGQNKAAVQSIYSVRFACEYMKHLRKRFMGTSLDPSNSGGVLHLLLGHGN